MYTIAIHQDDQSLMSGRRQSFSKRWQELAEKSGHQVRFVNALAPDIGKQVQGCDGFMWWFAHLPFPRNVGKRVIPALEHGIGIPCFPNLQTVWHFDDKVAQTYLLEAIGIPMPKTWVFWRYDDAVQFCIAAKYPFVFKLSSGIVSENVKLVRNAEDGIYWARRLFGAGVASLDRPGWPSFSNAYGRLRASTLHFLKGALPYVGNRSELQQGYFLAQEFLTGNAFDTRVTIIGNRAFAFRRHNRPNDFRASGSGRIDFDQSQIDLEFVRLAFKTARLLGTQSLAVDGLYREGEPVLAEISYYYEGWALADCPGHWRQVGDDLEFVTGHRMPEDAIYEDFMASLQSRSLAKPMLCAVC